MRVRIVHHDGDTLPAVVNADTGEPLEQVAAVSWKVDMNAHPRITVEMVLYDVEIDVVADSGNADTGINVWNVHRDEA